MFKQIAEQRYSLRHFDANRPVEHEKIDYVLQCACVAPSAVNLQPYHFFVVTNTQTLTALNGCYQREWFADAPVCVVACADHTRSWHRPNDGKDHADIDVAIAVDHLTLAAAEVGVGTCGVCNFEAKRCAAIALAGRCRTGCLGSDGLCSGRKCGADKETEVACRVIYICIVPK